MKLKKLNGNLMTYPPTDTVLSAHDERYVWVVFVCLFFSLTSFIQ